MHYNKNKHLKLLKSLPKSGNSIKNLSYEEFVDSKPDKPDENFLDSVMIICHLHWVCHLHWENREQYFELIEKLLNGPINFLPLRKKHRAINDAVEILEAELILLEPNPKCEGFDRLIDELISLFYRFCPDPNLRESHEFSDEELKKLIQKIFIEMKEPYP